MYILINQDSVTMSMIKRFGSSDTVSCKTLNLALTLTTNRIFTTTFTCTLEIKVGYKQRIQEVEANFHESMEREQEAMEAMESKYEKNRDQLREAGKKIKTLEKTVRMHRRE